MQCNEDRGNITFRFKDENDKKECSLADGKLTAGSETGIVTVITANIVNVPRIGDNYPIELLGRDAGLMEGFAFPGEGISLIVGHNTISAEAYVPFAGFFQMEVGDHFFVRKENGDVMIFEVHTNEKIEAHDWETLKKYACLSDKTLTLLTCEDERPEGGYASRRIISAYLVEDRETAE